MENSLEKFGYDINVIMVPTEKIKIRSGWNMRTDNIHEMGSVASLRCSIEEIGLMHPLQINKNYELVSGFRRYRVLTLMRWQEIPCSFVEYANELHERLANIDENIERRNLSDKDFDRALSEKKKIYGILYPHSVQTGPKSKDTGDKKVKSFADDTAEKSGLSKSDINKKVARVDNVTDEVRAAYEEEKINASQIDELVKLDKDDQNKILKKIQGTSVAETRMIVDDFQEAKKSKESAKLMGKDDKLLAAIFEVEKVIKAVRQADVLLEAFFHAGKNKSLDDEYQKRLRTNVNLILHTIDRRFKIDSFYEGASK